MSKVDYAGAIVELQKDVKALQEAVQLQSKVIAELLDSLCCYHTESDEET